MIFTLLVDTSVLLQKGLEMVSQHYHIQLEELVKMEIGMEKLLACPEIHSPSRRASIALQREGFKGSGAVISVEDIASSI